ncbi:MAG: lamin tail domain-containing protein, partial [Candidatus Limnocylindria bacterium]
MPVAPSSVSVARRPLAALASIGLLALAIDQAVAIPLAGDSIPLTLGHPVVSELMTGGASASDEFIELYNPTLTVQPLEGLEVVYVTSTGATVTRKAAWAAGAPGLAPGAHLLIANAAGIFAGIADATYANGLAATGGSVALRVQGAATAIDAVGWGAAASTWLETQPAAAPAAASSLERLPGGASGSGQDTDDNLVDFAVQPIPDPQNSGSPPIVTATPGPSSTADATASPTVVPSASETLVPTPSETPTPMASPSGTPSPTPTKTTTPTPSPSPSPISIAEARSLATGSAVLVEGVALTPADFTDGGGYLADAGAGIAVLLSDGGFTRGQLLRVTGTVDDRYAQRTIRSSLAQVTVVGAGSEPLPADAETGAIGEALEGQLVELTGLIVSSATTLSTGIAWDVDDGSGPIRVLIGTAGGIDTAGWGRGTGLTL